MFNPSRPQRGQTPLAPGAGNGAADDGTLGLGETDDGIRGSGETGAGTPGSAIPKSATRGSTTPKFTTQGLATPGSATIGPATPATPRPISMTLPLVLLLVAIFLTTCIKAQNLVRYTGNEPAQPFPLTTLKKQQVAPYPILQFLGARCTEITQLPPPESKRLYRYKKAHQHYPEYDRLPIDIYFQPATACLEDIYHLNSGNAKYHITLPMPYEGTYYVVIRDQTKPSVLIVNTKTQQAEFRRSCALTESIIPSYLH